MFRKRVFWIITIALVLEASGGGYIFYSNGYLQAQEAVEEETMPLLPERCRQDISPTFLVGWAKVPCEFSALRGQADLLRPRLKLKHRVLALGEKHIHTRLTEKARPTPKRTRAPGHDEALSAIWRQVQILPPA